MYESKDEVPATIALTWDLEHESNPDWKAMKNAHPDQETVAIIDTVKRLWDTSTAPAYAVRVKARDGRILAVGGGDDPAAVSDRRAVQQFKDRGIATEAGFDGKMAGGTRDNQFAWWLTPGVIWQEISENEELDEGDFDQPQIEEAIRNLINHNDWAWGQFNEMRNTIVDDARTLTAKARSEKEASNGN